MEENVKLAIGAGIGIAALVGIAYAFSAKAAPAAAATQATALTTGHNYSVTLTFTSPAAASLGNQNVTQALVAGGFQLQGSPTISGSTATATALFTGTAANVSALPTTDSQGDTFTWTSVVDQGANALYPGA